MENGSTQRELLTEEQLKRLSRHVKDYAPCTPGKQLSADDINSLRGLFVKVLSTAEDDNINTPHRVAAWNSLCALIDQCSESNCDAGSSIIWLHGIWDRAFELYIDHSHSARPKSSKQLLASLSASLLKKHDRSVTSEIVTKRLVQGITATGDHLTTKSCLQALAKFLSKDILSLSDLHLGLTNSRRHPNGDEPLDAQVILNVLFLCVNRGDCGSIVGQVIRIVLDKILLYESSDNISSEEAIWMRPLETAFNSNLVSLDDVRTHIFPNLFQRDMSVYIAFMNRHGLQDLDKDLLAARSQANHILFPNVELLYTAMQTGKELGLLYETDDSEMYHAATTITIPAKVIGRLLCQSSQPTRIAGLSLLITFHAATRPFPRSTLRILKRQLQILFADTDANFRGEVASLMLKLVDRMRSVTAVLGRTTASQAKFNDDTDSTASTTLRRHVSFLEWLLSFLLWELRPTASYQRHISALKTLSIVSRSGLDIGVPREYLSKSAQLETKWPFHLSIMTNGLQSLLLDLLLDPFDDVRQLAASILSVHRTVDEEGGPAHEARGLAETIHRAEHLMLRTGRADQADGVAHLYSLLSSRRGAMRDGSCTVSQTEMILSLVGRLENMLTIAESNLLTAVDNYPMHGLFTSLRYLITQNDAVLDNHELLARLGRCLHNSWGIVKPILCNDAPEGYLPGETEDAIEFSTKDTLSYCWRGLKEGSLLLQTIVLRESLSPETLLSLGNLCFTQLAELRHRGAFSTVAQTWVTCCAKCITLQSTEGKSVVHVWYDQLLRILTSKTTINTRRSAGLPALICGLLASDKSGDLTALAIQNLSAIAHEPIVSAAAHESSLPQVHSLNCIKDMLKSTRLREGTERYIPSALRLAAFALRSHAWSVRNCGLMLFRAVIDRLLGTSDAYLEDTVQSSHRLVLPPNIGLFEIVLDLLKMQDHPHDSSSFTSFEGVFPALQLLQRMQVPGDQLPDALAAVLALTTSKTWHVREKAARTYAALVPGEHVELEVKRCLDVSINDQNAFHGALLCVKYLIRKLIPAAGRPRGADVEATTVAVDALHSCTSLVTHATHFYHNNRCPVSKAAYLDILNEISGYAQRSSNLVRGTRLIHSFQSAQLDICEELKHVLDTTSSKSEGTVLLTTLARALGLEFHIWTNSLRTHEVSSLILRLAELDADACCSFFQAVVEGIEAPFIESTVGSDVLLEVSVTILRGELDTTLKCMVQRLLLALVQQQRRQQVTSANPGVLINACNMPSYTSSRQSNGQYADQWLHLQVVASEQALRIQSQDVKNSSLDMTYWRMHWCPAVRGESLISRDAAAMAISGISLLWRYLRDDHPRLFCEICFGIYDLLNDDDESVRLWTAQAASCICRLDSRINSESTLEPIVASQEHLKFMVTRWHDDAYFIREVFKRAFGTYELEQSTVADQLANLQPSSSVLFAEEKQNLFMDDAKEARLWSHVIRRVKATAIPTPLIRRLARWTSYGLDVLTQKSQAQIDGPLGWTSQANVFTLGLQVIYGAEILLHFVERGVALPVRPSELRLKLAKFNTVAVAGDINTLWQREIRKLTTKTAIGSLKRCMDVMVNIADPPAPK